KVFPEVVPKEFDRGHDPRITNKRGAGPNSMSEVRILVNLSNYGRNLILSPDLEARLHELGTVTHYNPDAESLPREAFLERVAASDIMITSWRSTFLESGDLGRTGALKLLIHGAGSVKNVVTEEIIASGVRTVQCA